MQIWMILRVAITLQEEDNNENRSDPLLIRLIALAVSSSTSRESSLKPALSLKKPAKLKKRRRVILATATKSDTQGTSH